MSIDDKTPVMSTRSIPIARPYFGTEERDAVAEAVASGWVVQGPRVREFEGRFAAFQNCDHAVATSSATTALHLALIVSGIEPGDEVLVPAFTYPASANVVVHAGATPVFVDVQLPDCTLETSEVAKKITMKTKAIMPVHLFGLPVDMDPIMVVARDRALSVIEDAACGHGAVYKGKMVGAIGDCGAFSFHPRKPISTGEGGMLTTNNGTLAETARILRSHGESVADEDRHKANEVVYPDFVLPGYNYRMTDIQGALGVEQVKKLPFIVEERRRIASLYDTLLSNLEHEEYLVAPPHHDHVLHTYQSYVLLLGERLNEKRDRLSNELQHIGVATRKGTYHVPGTQYYRERYGFNMGDFPNSEVADRRSLALPLYVGMTDEDVEYVVDAVSRIVKSL
jgi:dTDP-4-amino-4,6-dideoxygalactose transaminase